MKLIELRKCHKKNFIEMINDYEAGGDTRYSEYKSDEGFANYLKLLRDNKKGKNLKPGGVKYVNFWLVNSDETFVGSIRLRSELNEVTKYDGGHIGYDVPPSQRNRGYASVMLKKVLRKAKKIGLSKVLLNCYVGNVGSEKVIVKNGGIFDSVKISPRNGNEIKHFWINL